jgi:hypothetical protein
LQGLLCIAQAIGRVAVSALVRDGTQDQGSAFRRLGLSEGYEKRIDALTPALLSDCGVGEEATQKQRTGNKQQKARS